MKVYVIWECAVIEYEERFRIMSVHTLTSSAIKIGSSDYLKEERILVVYER